MMPVHAIIANYFWQFFLSHFFSSSCSFNLRANLKTIEGLSKSTQQKPSLLLGTLSTGPLLLTANYLDRLRQKPCLALLHDHIKTDSRLAIIAFSLSNTVEILRACCHHNPSLALRAASHQRISVNTIIANFLGQLLVRHQFSPLLYLNHYLEVIVNQ